MEPISEDRRSFAMSSDELRRREGAFDRLGLSTIVAFAIASADLFAVHLPVLLAGIVCLATLVVASRVWLAAGNRRYAHTTWDVGDDTLTRIDARSVHEYQLNSIRHAQAKRNTAGVIREIKLSFDDGSAVYVNGLEDTESFWDFLSSRVTRASHVFVREPIDYDHPLFYVALGSVLGASISLIVRFAASAPHLSGHWVYVALAVYSFAVSVYWSRAKPISGRYGLGAITWDRATAAIAFVCFVGSTIAAAML
ncbi:MAG: hypothetical protein CVT59_01015 [Actinobacteria bacterium HGW-Actinobacteria-1]|jgi:hypothetical protein|nr:MAG: hypothetical protein CVT59_01015 [Actinobacteria bacterium HGW-Actinobacteria-1]